MAISAHSEASPDSARLCDKLFAELGNLIPGTCTGIKQKAPVAFGGRVELDLHTCTIPRPSHRLKYGAEAIKLTCCRTTLALGSTGGKIPRLGWEESFPARFRIYRSEQIPVAAKYLKDISFRASSFK